MLQFETLGLKPINFQSSDAALSSPFALETESKKIHNFIDIFWLVANAACINKLFIGNIASLWKKLNKWIKFRNKAKQ